MRPIAALSLNHFKHITCGSGGMVLTDDDRLRHIASLFVDKCFQREEKIRNPFFVAPNYQMTELQGAVALAQLDRVHDIVASRNRLGTKLNALLAGVPAVRPQTVPQGLKQPISYIYFGSIWSFSAVPRRFRPGAGGRGHPQRGSPDHRGPPGLSLRYFSEAVCFSHDVSVRSRVR